MFRAFVPKEEIISTNKEIVNMGVIFLRNGILFDLKTKHIVC